MKTKLFILILVFLITAVGFTQFTSPQSIQRKKIKIAACPTYHQDLEKLNPEKYEIIKTDSTSQSINLLKNDQADMILAGRTLKPNEPTYDFETIREGYSFLNDKEISIKASQLKNYEIYTDLNIEELKAKFPITEIIPTENVYNHLKKGIIITSWENTDYGKGKIVHIIEDNGKRTDLSRQTMLYCATSCEEAPAKNLIKDLKKS